SSGNARVGIGAEVLAEGNVFLVINRGGEDVRIGGERGKIFAHVFGVFVAMKRQRRGFVAAKLVGEDRAILRGGATRRRVMRQHHRAARDQQYRRGGQQDDHRQLP